MYTHVMNSRYFLCSLTALLLTVCQTVYAGPIVIDGTDANDHGFVSGGVNQAGWEYMQRVLENLATQLGPSWSTKNVVDLGTSGSTARTAINSAFNLSSLSGAGWTLSHVDTATSVGNWLDNLSTANTGILYIPTYGNSSGDLDGAEMAAINAHANEISAFVNAGGALFAMGESGAGAWGWLTTLVPGLTVVDIGAGGTGSNVTLTLLGSAAFPGLTNADLAGADPWHNYFAGDLGGLQAMGTAVFGGGNRNVILGGSSSSGGGSIESVPEPGTLVTMLGLGVLGFFGHLRRRSKPTVASTTLA